MQIRVSVAVMTAVAWAPIPQAHASCDGAISGPDAVVRCALAASPEVRQARASLDALAGRRIAAGVWLPSNPVVAATVGRRRATAANPGEPTRATNWSVTLSQEFGIAGQRGARLDEVDAEAAAQVRRTAVAEQDVGAMALRLYFDAVASRQGITLANELLATSDALSTFAEARAREALISGVDADVVRAEGTRLGLIRLEAERRFEVSRRLLAIVVGRQGALDTSGDLETDRDAAMPDTAALEAQALRLRGEIAAAEMERRVFERHVSVLRRERIPNITVSAFAERDGFAEQVFGLGISMPIPLPAPLGRTRAGEIAETTAQIRVADSALELIRRRVRVEVAQAGATFDARKKAVALFTPDLLDRAKRDLTALREAIGSRQLSIREALMAQRSLIELLQANLDARLERALAWVELRRVVGLPLMGGQP